MPGRYEEAVAAELARQAAEHAAAVGAARAAELAALNAEAAELEAAIAKAGPEAAMELAARLGELKDQAPMRLARAEAQIAAPATEAEVRAMLAHLLEAEAPPLPEFAGGLDLDRAFYKLGGRYWSVGEVRFVEAPPAGACVIELGGPATSENLRQTLSFYGQPIGLELLELGEARQRRLNDLAVAFGAAQVSGVAQSALGFPIDATERANRDINGLITMLESGDAAALVGFCDAENNFHEVGLEELKAMRLEVIRHGQLLYARKWELRERILAAQSHAELAAIQIDFEVAKRP